VPQRVSVAAHAGPPVELLAPEDEVELPPPALLVLLELLLLAVPASPGSSPTHAAMATTDKPATIEPRRKWRIAINDS